MPQKVCDECFTELKIARNIRLKCIKSQKTLIELRADKSYKPGYKTCVPEFVDLRETRTMSDVKDKVKEEPNESSDEPESNCDQSEFVDHEDRETMPDRTAIKEPTESNDHSYPDCNSDYSESRFGLKLFKPLNMEAIDKIQTTQLKVVVSRVNLNLFRKVQPKSKNGSKLNLGKSQTSPTTAETTSMQTKEVVKCQYCAKEFTQKSMLQIHKRSKFCALNQSKCQHCPRTLKNQTDFLNHYKKCAGNPANKIYPKSKPICEFCGLVLTNKCGLRKHLVARHREMVAPDKLKMFPCSHCDKVFQFHYNLKVHENKKHLNIRNFKCHHCPKSFVENSYLKAHLLKHEDPAAYNSKKNYACHICPARYQNSTALSIHYRTHDLTLPHLSFHCLVCIRAFKNNEALMKHNMINHSSLSESTETVS